MKILILTKKGFKPAREIRRYLMDNGHLAFVHSDALPSDSALGGSRFDLAISCHYNRIIKKSQLDCFRYGAVNIHPSYLPYGRGSDPIIWSIVNGWPHGVSIHWIDEGIDTGNVLFQVEIVRGKLETGEELYGRMVRYYKHIFPIFWDEFYLKLRKGIRPSGREQAMLDAPLFKAKKRADLKKVGDLSKSKEVDVMLALTHSTYNNMYIECDGERYIVKLVLEKEL